MVTCPSSAASASTSPDDDDDNDNDPLSTSANDDASSSLEDGVGPVVAIPAIPLDITKSHAKAMGGDRAIGPYHETAAVNDDMRLAREIQIIDKLTSVYGFPHRLALDALEECGPLAADDENDDDFVVTCYNWILDNHDDDAGVVDGGGPVVPRIDCPHVTKRVRFRIFEIGMDGMETEVFSTNDSDEHTGSTTIAPWLAGEGGISTHRPEGRDHPDLMNVECQYHRYADMRRRRWMRPSREESLEGRTPFPAVGSLKSDVDDDSFDDAHPDTNIIVAEGGEGDDDIRARHAQPRYCPMGMNWLCLECGMMMCSRYANGHARTHYEITKEEDEAAGGEEVSAAMANVGGHCIAVCLADLSVWCYRCNAYLRYPTLDVVTKYLEGLKFGDIDARIVMTNTNYDETIVIGRDFTYSRSPLCTWSSLMSTHKKK
jgi:hypothetical protein